jgi:hypothetical protein
MRKIAYLSVLVRESIYVLDMVVEIARRFSIVERPRDYEAGLQKGRRDRTVRPNIRTAPNLDTAGQPSRARKPSGDYKR